MNFLQTEADMEQSAITKKMTGTAKILFPALLLISFFSFPASAAGLTAETGETDAARPSQPTSGPGGSDYSHTDITAFHYGSGSDGLWIYEPSGPAPDSAPVVLFIHGFGAIFPTIYGGWMRHLVLQGNIVIFPRYQESFNSDPQEMYGDAIDAIKRAFRELEKSGHVKPDTSRVTVVGHSYGGVMAANIAADWTKEGLPPVRAFMSVEPGDGENVKSHKFIPRKIKSIMVDYSNIPAETLMICLAGADDNLVGDIAAKKIFLNSIAVPAGNKKYVTVFSDYHGTPPLVADHMFPLATDSYFKAEMEETGGVEKGTIMKAPAGEDAGERDKYDPDAYDYYGPWRLFDALRACALDGELCDIALGEGPEAKYMGEWSDGTPVAELQFGMAED